MNIKQLSQTIMQCCDLLAQCTETPPYLTRTFLSQPMQDVHAHVRSWMEQAGMKVRIDAVGNIIGRKVSEHKNAKVFMLGSHLDTVKHAGKYDGMLGVLLGIALAEACKDKTLPFHLEVIGFSEEEGVRFGVPFIGSKAIAGALDKSTLELSDSSGITVSEAISNFGLNPESIPQAAYRKDDVMGYLEVHIEQGPKLASLNQPLGIVSAIVGTTRVTLSFTGLAGHAGTSPMNLRKDALAGAAEFILAVESYAKSRPDLVATVGRIEAKPGAGNVIAGNVEMSLDVRHIEDSVRLQAVKDLKVNAKNICEKRGLELHWQELMDQAAVPMSSHLIKLLEQAAGENIPLMSSGAGHDAMIMASLTPSAMLFVRSPNGISHHPDEMVLVHDVEVALDTILKFIAMNSDHL
jgi:allantoate deiminase